MPTLPSILLTGVSTLLLLWGPACPAAEPPAPGADPLGPVLEGVPGPVAALVRAHRLQPEEKKAPEKPASFIEVDLSFQDVDLGELFRQMEIKLPAPLKGRATLQARLNIPLQTPQDRKTYRLQGRIDIPQLSLAGVELQMIRAQLSMAEGIFQLSQLRARLPASPDRRPSPALAAALLVGPYFPTTLPAGLITGSIRADLGPQGRVTADLRGAGLPLGQVLRELPGNLTFKPGELSLDISFSAPAEQISQPATWTGSARVSIPRVEIEGVPLTDAEAAVRLANGVAELTTLKARIQDAALTGSGSLKLEGEYPYQAKVAMEPTSLEALQRLGPGFRVPFDLRGKLQLGAEVTGTLEPFSSRFVGTGRAEDLRVEQVQVDQLTFRWSGDQDQLALTDIQAQVYQGEVSGKVLVPLARTVPGSVDLRVKDLRLEPVVRSIPDFPVRLEGQVSGQVQGRLLPADPQGRRDVVGEMTVTSPQLRVQGIPAQRLQGHVEYRAGKGSFRLDGDSLGGQLHLDGRFPVPAEPPAPREQPGVQGSLRLEQLRVGELVRVLLPRERRWHKLRGRLNLEMSYRLEAPDLKPTGTGRLALTNVRWDSQEVVSGFRADLRLTEDELLVRNLGGGLLGGEVRGQMGIRLANLDRSWYSLTFSRIDASVLTMILGDGMGWQRVAATPVRPGRHDRGGLLAGQLTITVRGNLGRRWTGSGQLVLSRGQVLRLGVDEYRFPFEYSFSPVYGSGQITVADSTARFSRGRALGGATLSWGGNVRLEGSYRFFDVDTSILLGDTWQLSALAPGRMTGRLDFGSQDLRSVNDITASLRARLSQTQALRLPVLEALTPFVAPGQANTLFQEGTVEARLQRGVVNLRQLSLTSSYASLIVQGTIGLNGRLDLEATARTGTLLVNENLLELLGVSIPAVGPIPLPLIIRVSSYLSNRVLHLRITGTVRSPVVRIDPVRLLTEEAVRFFLLGSPLPLP